MNVKLAGLIFMVTLGVLGYTAHGQAQVSIGIKGGLNFSNLDVSNPGATYDGRTGYHFGAFTLVKLTKIGIQPEILFSQQGSEVKTSSGSFTSNFNYVNIPVLFKLYTVAGLNLQIGPQFGFLTNDPEVQDPQGQSIEDAYKNSDVSLALGIGWDLPLRLSIDARYNLGLSEINDNPSLEATKNQVWQISLGYKLFKFGN